MEPIKLQEHRNNVFVFFYYFVFYSLAPILLGSKLVGQKILLTFTNLIRTTPKTAIDETSYGTTMKQS